MVRAGLSPLAGIYGAVTDLRNLLYDRGIIGQVIVPCPVVSVGNLTLGGTGKTPIVDLIAGWFEKNGIVPLILSRGYRGHYRGVAKVDPFAEDAAELYGDEPVLLARRHPKAPVYVTRKRAVEAPGIYAREKPGVIILDDGFQHRRLKRDLDIVVLDTTAGEHELIIFPEGRARESVSSLNRADFVLLSKANLASPEQLSETRSLIPEGIPSADILYELEELVPFGGGPAVSPGSVGRVLAVSGIGNPKSFFKLLEQNGAAVAGELVFPDHHAFAPHDLEKIKEKKSALGVSGIVVTEKDAVKLKNYEDKAWIARLKIAVGRGEKELHESFRGLLR